MGRQWNRSYCNFVASGGGAVAGMSIDYVKCFVLMPQAVVLALALQLGAVLGMCPALRAMYKQLR